MKSKPNENEDKHSNENKIFSEEQNDREFVSTDSSVSKYDESKKKIFLNENKIDFFLTFNSHFFKFSFSFLYHFFCASALVVFAQYIYYHSIELKKKNH